MADLHAWVDTVGVVVGLGFTGISLWRSANQQELKNIMTFDDKHSALRKELYGREDVERIYHMDADLKQRPPTIVETQAVIRAIVSYQQGWKAATLSDREELEPLRLDIANFLSRPLPRLIWEQEKKYRIRKFVRFVERAVERGERLSAASG